MGLDSPLATPVALLISLALFAAVQLHVKKLQGRVDQKTGRQLTILRMIGVLLFALLLLRPYWNEETLASGQYRVVALADLSGSMQTKDQKGGPARMDVLRQAFDEKNGDSWLAKVREDYGRVDLMSFDEEVEAFRPSSWNRPNEGRKTALGDALRSTLSSHGPDNPLGAVVAFSDGRNNQGIRLMEVAREYLDKGIPINVVGIGDTREGGDLQIRFPDRNVRAIAKEPFQLKAVVRNEYDQSIQGDAVLWKGDERLAAVPFEASAGGEVEVNFPSITSKDRESATYRVTVSSPDSDVDPSNDADSALVEVLPPAVSNVLFLSNRATLNYRFIKAALTSDERFAFHALIRTGKEHFHVFEPKSPLEGERKSVMPSEYPTDPDFWIHFETIVLDSAVLDDLSDEHLAALRRFVDKRGGGMLILGDALKAREKLGGVAPVRQAEAIDSKDNRRVVVIEEPVFAPEDEVENMKVFLPSRLPSLVARSSNPAARAGVITRSGDLPALVFQAYGSGRVAYWGTMHDWRWPLATDRGGKDFRKFWLALTDWLSSGGEERVRTEVGDKAASLSKPVDLSVDVLGSDFEPSQDALVEAVLQGPDGKEEKIHLYPQGTELGRYVGSFRPSVQGEYKVKYSILMPDDESLEKESYFQVSDTSEESADVGFAERELEALCRMTGGNYYHYRDLDDAAELQLAAGLPTETLRHFPTDSWIFFLVLFLVAGIEWIIRRQAGLR